MAGRRATPLSNAKDWAIWLAAARKYVKTIIQKAANAAQEQAPTDATLARMASLPSHAPP